jgi:hypothetical protein
MKKLVGRLITLAMTAGLLVLPALASGAKTLCGHLTVGTTSHDIGRQGNTGNNVCKPVVKPKAPCTTSLTVSVTTTVTLTD